MHSGNAPKKAKSERTPETKAMMPILLNLPVNNLIMDEEQVVIGCSS